MINQQEVKFSSLETFIKTFRSSFWKKIIDETVIPHQEVVRKNHFLKQLHNDIQKRRFNPSPPRGYLVIDKHNGVARIVPVLELKDNCVYFFCIKQIEPEIAINRTEGTFGGWTLSNQLRDKEDEELGNDYLIINSYAPERWGVNWKSFQSLAESYYKKDGYSCFVKLDIANFYNSINLNLLEQKILLELPSKKMRLLRCCFTCFGAGINNTRAME